MQKQKYPATPGKTSKRRNNPYHAPNGKRYPWMAHGGRPGAAPRNYHDKMGWALSGTKFRDNHASYKARKRIVERRAGKQAARSEV